MPIPNPISAVFAAQEAVPQRRHSEQEIGQRFPAEHQGPGQRRQRIVAKPVREDGAIASPI
jgi:hypothetical protein